MQIAQQIKKHLRKVTWKIQKKQGIEANDEMVDKAWNQHLNQKRQEFLGNTRKVASSLAKGKSLDSFIDKEAFNKLANKNYDANLVEQEQAFKHFYKAKNPNATSKEVDSAWDEQKRFNGK
ncbi:hypothetical protein ACU82A_31820 [Bacillus cereus]